ncbi:hypothetical protein [uncultured Prevotella sp.]|uniref:hypothetical protein n=1 Tax=uncultured Prevotella sp. TaxID=159272 RepID=UPI002638C951|nr:hypothetical protein [uncultured Prevotella sp.]
MKKLPILLLAAVLALCSCSKSYQELVNEKVEQYKKDGKIILNKSDDPTGKEQYIVFADVEQQTIGVDTLGEEAQIIKLKDIKEQEIDLSNTRGSDTFSIYSNISEPKASNIRVVDCTTFKEKVFDSEDIMKAECYKNKYILMTNGDTEYVRHKILFFKQPSMIFNFKDNAIEKTDDGDLNITIKSFEIFGATKLDQESVESIFHVTLNSDGFIKKQDDCVNLGGIMIPTSAYGNAEDMEQYLNRIENDRELNYNRALEKENSFLEEWLVSHPECRGMSFCEQITRCHQDTGFNFDINGQACRDAGE